ncbi:lytic transglycosylase domain-containing protein [Thiomonas sp.]|jgi:soluble lytic murein transglycosylase-like protein|uniref:lytic transglycosylase domain-containing protein n=1 Tax=Thiomonas sp. TaxID=2047785 RepID=UPI002603505E|nr:lytic transglycosylase domain-containing protein [Thiomonas sp.]
MRSLTRRRWLLQAGGASAAAVLGWSLPATPAWAGAQQEEQLSDAVRTALAAQIAQAPPPKPHFRSAQHFGQYWFWLANQAVRLQTRMPVFSVRRDFLQTLWYEAHRAGLETALVLGLIQVESGFQKYAISPAGAMGYMQVMPFWTRQIGNGDVSSLFHMQVNLRYGCVILRHYLNIENGDLFYALGRYNGSRGRAAYPDAVLAARRNWLVAGGSG